MLSAPISEDKIQSHIDNLSQIGNLGPNLEDGFLRAAWSNEESQAMEYIAKYAETEGFECRYDEVGNLFISFGRELGSILQLGSHLDTVPKGGLFDGGAGIIAGIEALISIKNTFPNLKHGLELVIWRGEESATYNAVFMGSKAAFGKASSKLLSNRFKEETLREAIEGQGFSVAPIEGGLPTIPQSEIDKITAHLELHIEQARKLEIDQLDIGVITSIRAPRRFRVLVKGESAHSGATPMDLRYRRDAILTFQHIGVRLHEAIIGKVESGQDLVQTIGVINSDYGFNQEHPEIYENSMTNVNEFSYFLLDIRGNVGEELDNYTTLALDIIRETANEFGTEVDIETLAEGTPVEDLDPDLRERLLEASEELELAAVSMPSGGGHDAAIVAQQRKSNGATIPTGMIFIPCREGISHNPKEFATTTAITKGAQVIAEAYSKYQIVS